MSSIDTLLNSYRNAAETERAKGTYFECQSASNFDPGSACNFDPSGARIAGPMRRSCHVA